MREIKNFVFGLSLLCFLAGIWFGYSPPVRFDIALLFGVIGAMFGILWFVIGIKMRRLPFPPKAD